MKMNPGANSLFIQTPSARYFRGAVFLFVLAWIAGTSNFAGRAVAMEKINETIELPAPRQDSEVSIERALRERRSIREFSNKPITLQQLSQLLWSAQGITSRRGFRTAPSAGALYPLQLYVVVGNVTNLPQGIYKYQTNGHRLIRISAEDKRKVIARAAWGQRWVRNNAALVVFSVNESRTTRKYGRRGIRYVHIEVGHAAQNLFLQAQALGLGAAVVGAFGDDFVEEILDLPKNERPIYLMPVGKPR